ncbi:hypothetical protein ABPG74_022472 [Tetrahymena malaccensis]
MSFAIIQNFFEIKHIKALSLTILFLEDIYCLRYLKCESEEQEIDQYFLDMNQRDFQEIYRKLFELIYISNFFLAPAEIITFLWSLESRTLKINFIGIYVIISFGIRQYLFWMAGLFKLYHIWNRIGFTQAFIQEIIITSLNYLTCFTIFIYNLRLEYFIQLYLIFNMFLVHSYYRSIRNRAIYSEMYFLIYPLIIKMLCHVDVEGSIILQNYRSIGSLTLNKTIKFSIMQKLVLYLFYFYNLKYSADIDYYQYFQLLFAIISITIQILRFGCNIDIINFRNPYKIEIDNLQDLKRNISEYENQKNQSFYKNLETVEIYIQIQDFSNQSELVNCLFCAFGKSEINSSSYERKYQSKYFQKIKIQDYLIANSIEIGLKNYKILPQIVELEAYIYSNNSIQLTKQLFENNCILQLFYIEVDYFQDIPSINSYNKYVIQVQATLMQIIAYNKTISIEQIFNPKIIFYDMYDQ